jgi:hypothetical protein
MKTGTAKLYPPYVVVEDDETHNIVALCWAKAPDGMRWLFSAATTAGVAPSGIAEAFGNINEHTFYKTNRPCDS